MDETISLIFDGCKLARELESSLPNLPNQPDLDALLKSCDEIIRVFTAARERLPSGHHRDAVFRESSTHPQLGSQQPPQQTLDQNLQEWWRTSRLLTMVPFSPNTQQPLVAHLDDQGGTSFVLLESQAGGIGTSEMVPKGPVLEVGGHGRGNVQPVDFSDAGTASSSLPRPRRRKDDTGRRTVRAPAPTGGNLDVPPEDGFTWRKYGQKEILGSKFPRAYFRCTHQKLYQCPAKKQVQRSDDDPLTYEVTYRGEHTCHMSATAPISVPLRRLPSSIKMDTRDQMTQIMSPPDQGRAPPYGGTPLGSWLEFSLGARPTGSSSMAGGAGPSNTRHGKEAEYPVADMADALFNSGSSSSNSMEFIFTSKQNKEDPEDEKK